MGRKVLHSRERRLELPFRWEGTGRASLAGFLTRNAWKFGLGLLLAALLTTRGAGQIYTHPHGLAVNVLPTDVPCGQVAADPADPTGLTATWTAIKSPYGSGSPYNLPVNATNNPPGSTVPSCSGIVVPKDFTLTIDARDGPVQIFSHGAGIRVDGGHLLVLGKDATNSVLFDAEPDVASWDGITIAATDAGHRGNASMAYSSIQHALTSITITSGATSTPNPSNLTSSLPYGLAFLNGGIGPSYFDGIDATDTPIQVVGRANPLTNRADGQFGTVNNIGSQGIKVVFTDAAPTPTANALDVENVAFGSSVPFGETLCPPLQACAAGSIGNDAILGTFTPGKMQPVSINQNRFYRAGSFGIELNGANRPVITRNNFDCNGSGSPKPKDTCVGPGLKYSAVYLNNATADLESSVIDNIGHEDGLDAIVFNGTVVFSPTANPQVLTWKNATNDAANDHPLGYLLNGTVNLNGGTFKVAGGSVVKSRGGPINLTSSTLDAGDAGPKLFTSLRDNTNIATCPSVFVPSCPAPLPAGEWGGINLNGAGSNATINQASIEYATVGVTISNGATTTSGASGFGLSISNSLIGPSFADGVVAIATPLSVTATTFGCPPSGCVGPQSQGDHGINADFAGSGASLAGGLKIGGTVFSGTVNEAIRGTGLSGQTVDIEDNTIDNAGAYGIQLQAADHLTLQRNTITNSGKGNAANPVIYPAVYLNRVDQADFRAAISGNRGAGNGLDAIVFHGTTATALTWQTPANLPATTSPRPPLGYMLDDSLAVSGNLTFGPGALAQVLKGSIAVRGGALQMNGAVVTSFKETGPDLSTCGSIFVPRVSGACPRPAAGDWGGFMLDPGQNNQLIGSEIRYGTTGIAMGQPPAAPAPIRLSLSQTNIRNMVGDGITTRSPLSVSQGAFTSVMGRGIAVDLSAAGAGASLTVDRVTIAQTGQEGLFATGLAGQTVVVSSTAVDRAGAAGITLKGADRLTLVGNTITNSGYPTAANPTSSPAIYLNGFSGVEADFTSNRGANNAVNALAFHGTVIGDLTWQTARNTGDPSKLLGFLLDGNLDMSGAGTLEVNAGDVVKVGNTGSINLNGGRLKADDIGTSSQKIFTSLADTTIGVTCPSALSPGCPAPVAGDWGGIRLTGNGANGSLVNAAVRYASTGITISSGGSVPSASPSFGLVIWNSTIGPVQGDAITATKTSISVMDSVISDAGRGINADLTGAPSNSTVLVSGNRFRSTSAEAILGQALAGQPVWITDNRIVKAQTFGIRLVDANQLVLRNNNITESGTAAPFYPAIYLKSVAADFSRNIRGNVGKRNQFDAIVFDGIVQGDLDWITPGNVATAPLLGYLLDGGLTIQNGSLTIRGGAVVKSLGGPITISGGTLKAAEDTGPKTFTSLKDNTAPVKSCPSFFAPCGALKGDWGGLVITDSGLKGSGFLKNAAIRYAETGIFIDSGPIVAGEKDANNQPLDVRLTVSNGSTIYKASKDGINSLDTPISVTDSFVGNELGTSVDVDGRGIIASFFSPANCPPAPAACSRLKIDHTHVAWAGKDGIIANGLNGQPVTITNNSVTHNGSYGIRLVGADQLTLSGNAVNSNGAGNPNLLFPAIYLNGVTADFNVTGSITGNSGILNGLDALVFHGTASNGLLWTTPGNAGPTLGYMLDGPLTVNGTFTSSGKYLNNVLVSPGVVKVLTGGVKINGALSSIDTVFTSMKENTAPLACNTVFVPSACPVPVLKTDYWGGINIDANPSSFQGGAIRAASTGLAINSSTLRVSNTILAGITGYAVSTSGTGSAQVDCASIHDNGGGVLSQGAPNQTTVTYSNLFANKDKDINADVTLNGITTSVATTATNNWPGPVFDATKYSTSVKVNTPLPVEPPTFKQGGASITFSSDNGNSSTNPATFGKGTLTVTLTADREVDPTVPFSVTLLQTGETVPHVVLGKWKADNLTWQGTAVIDPAANAAGLNSVTISGAQSCIPEGTNTMPKPESVPMTLDFSKASILGTGSATSIGAKSATFNESVNPKGWSDPVGNVNKDTYVFFQYRLDSGAYDPVVIPADPTALLGYQRIGHGTTVIPVGVQVGQLLSPSTVYEYRAVAVDLNGITTGPDHRFTTLGPLDHFGFASIASPQTAGIGFSVQVTAYDSAGNVITDYGGSAAVVSGNLSAAPAGCTGPCTPQYGSRGWNQGVGTIMGVTAYVAEDNRTLSITDGSVNKTSMTFKVNSTGTPAMLWFTTASQTLKAGTLSGTITVAQTDAYGNPIAVSSNMTVSLTTGSATGTFKDLNTPANTITTVTIAASSSSASLRYADTIAGSQQIKASPPGGSTLPAATQTETVTAP